MPYERKFYEYESATGKKPVKDWYDSLDAGFKGKLDAKIDLFTMLPEFKPPNLEKIDNELWELRALINKKKVRIYMTKEPSGPNFIFVHAVIKTSKKLKSKDKSKSKSRIKELNSGTANKTIW